MSAETQNHECLCESCDTFDFTQLDKVLDEYRDLQGNLIIILQEAQEIYGYLPREVIKHISEETGYTEAKIYGVATFYAQFRLQPIGKYLIMLCKGTACHVSGADRVEEAIVNELEISDGETTEDRLFTLNNVACLGCCSLAPVMMVKTDEGEETYGKLTPESVIAIINSIRKKEDLEA